MVQRACAAPPLRSPIRSFGRPSAGRSASCVCLPLAPGHALPDLPRYQIERANGCVILFPMLPSTCGHFVVEILMRGRRQLRARFGVARLFFFGCFFIRRYPVPAIFPHLAIGRPPDRRRLSKHHLFRACATAERICRARRSKWTASRTNCPMPPRNFSESFFGASEPVRRAVLSTAAFGGRGGVTPCVQPPVIRKEHRTTPRYLAYPFEHRILQNVSPFFRSCLSRR